MNKLSVFVLLACVAVAFAVPLPDDVETDSETFLNPDDSEETADLTENKKAFSDFCLSSRDYVYGDIKTKTNGVAGWMFRLVFSSAEAVGRDAIDTQKLAVERLGKQIENPDSEIAQATNEVEEIIAEGQKRIKEQQIQPKTLYQAFLSTIGATKNVVANHIREGFASLRSRVGIDAAIQMLDDACVKIAGYEAELRDQFNAYKQEVVARDPSLAGVIFESLPCVTSKRIIRADGICRFAKAAQDPVTKIMQTRVY